MAYFALMFQAFFVASLFRGSFIRHHLPAAPVLDNLGYRMISVAFPTLTLVLVTGALWAHHVWGSFWSWDPKETWSLIAWLVYAFYLHARLRRAWKGRPTAVLALVGLAVIIFTFLGVNLGLSGAGLHVYGAPD